MTCRSYVELHVPDFVPVKTFYGALGFTIAWESEGPGHSGYLVMRYDDVVMTFWPGNDSVASQSYFGRFPRETPRGYGVEIVITVRDLDALYMRAQEINAVVKPLGLRPWGLRDFRAADPFGYYLRFNEPHDVLNPYYGLRNNTANELRDHD